MLKYLLKSYFVLLVLLTVFRLLNFLIFKEKVFSDLTQTEIFFGLVYGLRFDLSTVSAFLIPCFLVVPLAYFNFPGLFRRLFVSYIASVFSFFLLVLIVDLLYFFEVSRHLFDEPVSLLGDLNFTISMIAQSYLLHVACFIFASAIIFKLFFHYLFPASPAIGVLKGAAKEQKVITYFAVTLCLLPLSIRGGLQHKPISVVDAFYLPKASSAQLALNGIFSTIRASLESNRGTDSVNFFNQVQLDEILLSNHRKKSGSFWFRGPVSEIEPGFFEQFKRPNVFVFLLESFGSYYVDSFGSNAYGVTPFFDSIAEKSLRFPHFFAVGTRSIEAIQSILTSFPGLRGVPALGSGFEMLSVERLGKIAQELGYQSQFFQSAHRGSFRLNSVARSFGFDQYFGYEDFPVTHGNSDSIEPVFGWDDRTFQYLINRMDSREKSKPMLSFLFTGTAHSPFVRPPNAQFTTDHEREGEKGYLNTLRYTDDSLKHFFSEASSKEWFSNSIFIVTADHTLQRFRNGHFNITEHHKVPLIIYSPKMSVGRNDPRYASHVDIFPTLVSLMGGNSNYSLVGDNLLGKSLRDHVLVLTRYGFPFVVSEFGYLQHNLRRRVDSEFSPSCNQTCQDDYERSLLSTYQYLSSSLSKNLWVPR